MKNTAKPRVAIFAQSGFPFYIASPRTSPRGLVRDFKAISIEAEILDVAALADAARFNSKTFDAVILPHGNTYPRAAFPNLLAFHRAGGALVLSGIPFTHPVVAASFANWMGRPEWGGNVYATAAAHSGAHALEIKGRREWTGVDSPRFAAKAGDDFAIEAWAQNVSGTAGNDHLFVRFFDADGKFLKQIGPQFDEDKQWHRISAQFKAPDGTATWDISPQIRSEERIVRLDDIKVTLNGALAPIANSDFEILGNEWRDIGHDETALSGENGIGAGRFAGPEKYKNIVRIPPADPFHLKALDIDFPSAAPQWLAIKSLPPEVKVTPALLWDSKPLAALLQYPNGAVTVWTNHPAPPDADGYFADQFFLRGTVAALAMQKKISNEKLLFARLNDMPRPKRYVNLKLPTPRRPYETFQPKSKAPAARLHVADMRRLKFDEKVLLVTLQGIVNRKQPRVYLIHNDDDKFWLGEMQKRGQTGEPIEVAKPLTLVDTFREELNGATISDPKIYASACVAASLASADSLVVATPELAAQLHLPIRADLRNKFGDNAAALKYLRTKIFPRLNPYLACCLDPAMHDNGALDDVIAARGAVFWITGHKAQDKPGADGNAELEEVRALLAQMPLNAVVRGFWWHGDGMGIDEGPGVSLGSRFGKVTIVSDGVANFSVYSGVPLASLKQKPQAPPPALDKSKIYIAFTMSDGDNLTTWRKYFRDYFNDPLHGTFPMGWGMGPTIIDTAPVWAQWYYDKATPNDEFICDVSGVGYIYPPDWAKSLDYSFYEMSVGKDNSGGAMREFYKWTGDYMQRMDMRGLRIMNVEGDDIARAGKLTPQAQFLVPDYGYGGNRKYAELTYSLPTGQPVFRAISYDGTPEKMANDIRSRIGTARPAFANVFIWNWGMKLKEIKQVLDLLGPDYVAVTPSQLAALYKQAQDKSLQGVAK